MISCWSRAASAECPCPTRLISTSSSTKRPGTSRAWWPAIIPKFEAYIAAQNKATDTSRAAVEKLIPLAEELKIIIALENVWNNLWVQPKLYKNFVASFNHPYVRSYFDVGNHVKYRKTPVHEWIPILGQLDRPAALQGIQAGRDDQGRQVGSPSRRRQHRLESGAKGVSDINFDGWASIEEGGLPLTEFESDLT